MSANGTKCVGLFGVIFGHKFWSYDIGSDHCLRCGFIPGGAS